MTAQERAVMKQALEALEAMKAEFRAYDLPYGSKAYTQGNEASNVLRAALEQEQEQEKEQDMTEWHSGPPPSLGWWPCEIKGWSRSGALRWWDGRCWSWAALPSESAAEAAQWSSMPVLKDSHRIQWSDRPDSWPERSRT
jgi:hypothetical protein